MELNVEFGFTSTDMHQTCLVWGSLDWFARLDRHSWKNAKLQAWNSDFGSGFLAPGFDKWTKVVQALTLVKNGRSCKSGLTDPIFFCEFARIFRI